MTVSASPRHISNSAPFIPALLGHIGAIEKVTISSSDHDATAQFRSNPSALSSSLDEIPGLSSYVATTAPKTSDGSITAYDDFVPAPSPYTIIVEQRQRRTYRTIAYDQNGGMVGATINLETGEVSPRDYKNPIADRPKARRNPNAPDVAPFWMSMSAAKGCTGLLRHHDDSRKKQFNSIRMYLSGYISLDAAIEDLPLLGNIIESVALIDIGKNTRPLNRNIIFSMLQNLDMVTPETVMEFMGCSKRHAQKVALCLRVIMNAFNSVAEEKLSTGTH